MYISNVGVELQLTLSTLNHIRMGRLLRPYSPTVPTKDWLLIYENSIYRALLMTGTTTDDEGNDEKGDVSMVSWRS